MHAAHTMVATNSPDNSWFHSAISSYVHTTASQLKQAPEDIRWFAMYPCEVLTGKELSFADDLSSPECILSASIATHAASVECMLLDAEHTIAEQSQGMLRKLLDVDENIALRSGTAVDEGELHARVAGYVNSPPDARLMRWLQVWFLKAARELLRVSSSGRIS